MTTTPTAPSITYHSPAIGTMEYYSDHFSDVLADVGESTETIENVIAGFVDATTSWLDYHRTSAERYALFATKLTEALSNATV